MRALPAATGSSQSAPTGRSAAQVVGCARPSGWSASGHSSGSARARVLERLRSPGLSVGIARELRKQEAILEQEITELV
jgi:hypothetical protein